MVYTNGDIGKCLALRRRELGRSQTFVAAKAGLTQSMLSDIERGRDARVSTIASVAEALDLQLVLVPIRAVALVREVAASVPRGPLGRIGTVDDD